jgi:hypothetical protein
VLSVVRGLDLLIGMEVLPEYQDTAWTVALLLAFMIAGSHACSFSSGSEKLTSFQSGTTQK